MHRAPLALVFVGCFVQVLACAGSETGGPGTGSGTAGTTGSAGTGTTGSAGTGTTGSAGTGTSGSAGTTGSAGTGTTGTAGTGTTGTAGTTGSAGRGGTTGSAGRGGTTGTAGTTGSAGATGTGGSTTCTITPTAMTSTKIGTVGIVTFTTTLANPTSAKIDFGLTTSYGMTAPVDLTAASYRTLLLGMKPSMMYHYRVTVTNASGSCEGTDGTIMTGAQMNGLPTITVTNNNKAAVYPGFIVTGTYTTSGGANAYILDTDGTYVWWYNDTSDACGPRMSYDGKYMWIASANVPDQTTSDHTHRITMDGLTDTDFSTAFAHHSHQVTPLPDGSVAFYTTGTNGCDDIKIFPANGTPTSTATTLTNARTAHGGSGACHLNNIEYSPSDDTLIFSDLDNSCLTKINRTTGAMVWVMDGINGVTSTFTGDLWKGGEHGFHVIAVDDLLIFNNNSSLNGLNGTGSGSIALELKLNTTAKTVMKVWSYTASPAISVDVLGDVQRLPNGNTIVDYATKSTLQEVDSSGAVLQQIKTTGNFGYIEKRATLYGPSTK
jgi:hypothetical protein